MNAKLNTITNLRDLRDYLNALDNTDSIDVCNLPVFGGEEPRDTHGIYSWDATHVLTHYQDEWAIEPRE
jgi:hypothetical protein